MFWGLKLLISPGILTKLLPVRPLNISHIPVITLCWGFWHSQMSHLEIACNSLLRTMSVLLQKHPLCLPTTQSSARRR